MYIYMYIYIIFIHLVERGTALKTCFFFRIYISISMYINTHTYIHLVERGTPLKTPHFPPLMQDSVHVCVFMCVCVCVCVCMPY